MTSWLPNEKNLGIESHPETTEQLLGMQVLFVH
jgi:hypothetical protein